MKFHVWITLVMLIGISQMGVIPRKTVNKDDDDSGWVYIMHLEAVDAQGNPLNTCNCDDPFLSQIGSSPTPLLLNQYQECKGCESPSVIEFGHSIRMSEVCLALEATEKSK